MLSRAHKVTLPTIGLHADLAGMYLRAFICVWCTTIASAACQAQGFSAVISPPRFEVTAQPGKTTRQVIEITHVANQPGKYRVYTNDWSLASDGNAVFSDELAPNSCRPWVALERRDLALPPNGKVRFRFEISPPADSLPTECRFAIMIEGLEEVIKTEGAVSFPVSGRVGVIVYAIVGSARPKLEIIHGATGLSDGIVVPQLRVTNNGNAHGRLSGYLVGVDALGKQIDFLPEALPILPAQTRNIPLIPNVAGNPAVTLIYPLTIKGSLEWGDAKTDVDLRFEAPVTTSAPPSLPSASPLAPLGPGTAGK